MTCVTDIVVIFSGLMPINILVAVNRLDIPCEQRSQNRRVKTKAIFIVK